LDSLPRFGAEIEARGWAATSPLIPATELHSLRTHPALAAADDARGGVRNLLDVPAVRALARTPAVRTLASSVLGPSCFAVRGLLFDKRAAANWKVPWHQDLAVAVHERGDAECFGPWSVKGGVPHAQAPADVLERILAVRVHLDDCGPENGPLRVIPGSHRAGKLSAAAIEAWVERGPVETGMAAAGAILAFRPLLLHASGPATAPGPRRVIHLEFTATELPSGLAWRWVV
jgi:ectoine hydroxylase-related dioxygenase (phytanoyl-CoA dioxygenase family)